jgi:hypothetical protein
MCQIAQLQHHALGDLSLEFMQRLAAPLAGSPSWSRDARASNRFAAAHLGSWLPGMGSGAGGRGRRPAGRCRLPCDHRHRTSSAKGVPYAFESAHRLLDDFFAEVDRVIKEAQQ